MSVAIAVTHGIVPFACSLAASRVARRASLGTFSVQSLIFVHVQWNSGHNVCISIGLARLLTVKMIKNGE